MISNGERDLNTKIQQFTHKNEVLKLHVLLNIIQTISYTGREVRLSKLVKGRQRQIKFRNVNSFG